MQPWIPLVLDFWFRELKPDAWFTRNDAVDAEIRKRFADVYVAVNKQVPAEAATDPKVALASVIVLDQFPRNMFRGTPEAFASDPLALATSRVAIAAHLDERLSVPERTFLYMPFQHSEDLETQRQSVELFTQLGAEENLRYAIAHRDVIERFGRFPHRNAILRRPSTPEEIEFMKTHPGF